MDGHRAGRFGSLRPALAGVAAALIAALLPALPAQGQVAVLQRVNAGGPALGGTPGWQADTSAAPSAFANTAVSGNATYAPGGAVALDASVPAGTPAALFADERWDPPTGAELRYDLPVPGPGPVAVRLYFAELWTGAQTPGGRVFDVAVDGELALDDYDVVAEAGFQVGVMECVTVAAPDGSVQVDLTRVVQNPAIKGIEIVSGTCPLAPLFRVNAGGPAVAATDGGPAWAADTAATPSPLVNAAATGNTTFSSAAALQPPDPSVPPGTPTALFADERWDGAAAPELQWDIPVGQPGTYEVRLHFAEIYGGAQGVGQRVFDVAIEGATVLDDYDVFADVGGYRPVTKTFTVTSDATLDIDFGHVTENPAIKAIEVLGDGDGGGPGPAPIVFGSGALAGESSEQPTSLQFGPDGRLYVAQRNGLVKAYTVQRSAANTYAVTATETIDTLRTIPNHDDSGALLPGLVGRLVTGIAVTGTAAQPVIYATSSDARDYNSAIDTNSGMVSRLTATGPGVWTKVDLVRGLPRSTVDHATNGLALAGSTLYVTVGGHANQGGPFSGFGNLAEYALSGAILSVDLAAIGDTTYDLPTLDDPARPGVADAGDPFGGNKGANQALLVPGGPVQVHSPGWRNPYDVVVTATGELFSFDNGPNGGLGAPPIGEGPGGTCTNANSPGGQSLPDNLHRIPGAGYYAGHPNPTRANAANTFAGQSPIPGGANPVECDYRAPGPEDGALATHPSSTGGLAEYTAATFGGALRGDLLVTSLDGSVQRLDLDAAGTGVVAKSTLFSGFGSQPLDVTAQGDAGPFPGTVWVALFGSGGIQVFEPAAGVCSGADSAALDEDGDGFDNADELDNATDPCSAGSTPPDADGDDTSDSNDPDDDNDGLPDTSDPFAVDPANGATSTLPLSYTFSGSAGGLLQLGFTGLMTNATSDYAALFDPANMTAGGAPGILGIDAVPAGDAIGAVNTQQYGFQSGVQVGAVTEPFLVRTRLVEPFAGITPGGGAQSFGLFIGTGGQDDYLKWVVSGVNGGGVEVLREVGGAVTAGQRAYFALPGPTGITLTLRVDPVAGTAQPSYAFDGQPPVTLGAPLAVPAGWLDDVLAVGVISTTYGGPTFPAAWDTFEVVPAP